MRQLAADRMANVLVAAEEIAGAWGPVERGDGFLWRALKDPQLDATRQQRTAEQAEAARGALELVRHLGNDASDELLLSAPKSVDDAVDLVRIAGHLSDRPSCPPSSWLTAETFEPVEHRFEELRRLRDSYRKSEEALRGTLGERWRSADPDAADRVNAASDALRELAFPLNVHDQASIEELQTMHEFLARAPATVEAAGKDAEKVAWTFGFSGSRVSLARALELAELGDLAANEAARPESEWFGPEAIYSGR